MFTSSVLSEYLGAKFLHGCVLSPAPRAHRLWAQLLPDRVDGAPDAITPAWKCYNVAKDT